MSLKIVKLQGSTVLVIDNDTSEILETIQLNEFSYEFNEDTVQLVDSSRVGSVFTIPFNEFLDDLGGPLSNSDAITGYLSGFAPPVGSVTIGGPIDLAPGTAVQLIDDLNEQLPQANQSTNPDAKGLVLLGESTTGKLTRLRTTEDGRLVSTAQVINPPASTPLAEVYQSNVTGVDDQDYIIPLGDEVVLQSLSAGAEADTDGSKVELFYFTDATKLTGFLLSALYVNGSNGSETTVFKTPAGNGVDGRITIRRSRLAGPQREIYGKWVGYY